MKTKILATVLAGVLAASCAPATIASPSETPTIVLTFTSAPPTETQTPLASAKVASNRNGVGYEKGWIHINGWSEAVFDYMREIEQELLSS